MATRVLRLPVLLLLVLGTALVAGCSSRNPFTPPARSDLEGLYEFTQFDFTPQASGIAPANVLEVLVPTATTLELFGGGDVLLRYRVGDNPSALISGTFDAASDRVRIQFNDTQNRLPRLLLRSPVTFQRPQEGVLSLSGETVVNLAAFNPERYAGLTEVPGTLRISLRRFES